MRFAITCSDRFQGVFRTLVTAGWEPLKLFTVPVDNRIHRNKAVIEYAQQLGLDVQLSRLRDKDLAELAQRGCDVLVLASYNWRIGNWRPHLKYAINFHPSPLPEARGPYPAVRALLEGRRSWAMTCHQVAPDFDTGNILATEPFALSDSDTHESLDLKTQMAGKRLASKVAKDFENLWDAAAPQSEGSYWPHWTDQERTLDFSQTVDDILRRTRAFGLIQCKAMVNGISIFVKELIGWTESHLHPLGAVVHNDGSALLVAVRDGYVGIVEWSLIDPGATVSSCALGR